MFCMEFVVFFTIHPPSPCVLHWVGLGGQSAEVYGTFESKKRKQNQLGINIGGEDADVQEQDNPTDFLNKHPFRLAKIPSTRSC